MGKNNNLKIWLIVAAIIIVLFGVTLLWRSADDDNQDQNEGINNNLGNTINTVSKTLPDGLQIIDEVVGTGPEALAGNAVAVNYLGTLSDGTKFDSSYDRGEPFVFILGAGQVIKGWDEGVSGMKVGGKRKLVIPPSLGYGAQTIGPIPANSTLIFEVELLGVQSQ